MGVVKLDVTIDELPSVLYPYTVYVYVLFGTNPTNVIDGALCVFVYRNPLASIVDMYAVTVCIGAQNETVDVVLVVEADTRVTASSELVVLPVVNAGEEEPYTFTVTNDKSYVVFFSNPVNVYVVDAPDTETVVLFEILLKLITLRYTFVFAFGAK